MLIATELGVAEEWGTILQSMEEHLDEFEDHLCEKTGKVYTSWKNFEFIKLCSGKMPFTINDIEGKHYALVVSTYHYHIQHGVIEEGWQAENSSMTSRI